MLYGGSGAGKSASYVIPNAAQLLGSYVFTDPKGELYDKTAGYFKSKGYAAIAYEKQPVVTDTVPTKYADGTPFWSDYVTPNNVWTC